MIRVHESFAFTRVKLAGIGNIFVASISYRVIREDLKSIILLQLTTVHF